MKRILFNLIIKIKIFGDIPMKFLYSLPVLAFGALISGCAALNIFEDSSPGEKFITQDLIQKDISFLASDSLKGRNTPSPELDIASDYISNSFGSYGLGKIDGSYLQKVKLGLVNLGRENYLSITKDGKEISFNLKDDFTPFEMTANKHSDAPIVFAGYGIDAPEFKYNDYDNLDVNGKIVFVLRHEPGENDTASIFNGKESTKYSNVDEKVRTAVKHGAIGVLVAQDPLNHSILTPKGFPWPSLSKIIPKDAIPLSLMIDEKDKIPVVQVGESVIEKLFGSVENLKNIQSEIDKNLKPNSFNVSGAEASLKTSTEITDKSSNNVAGFIEGSDPVLKSEVVVIGAHYDHVGYISRHQEGEDFIYNGADDNASGTCGVLAVAKAFSESNQKPKRSVLFIAFCGEEKGLFGSRSYVENPSFTLEKTVAMLNMDMIGRNNPDSLTIYGNDRNPDLLRTALTANEDIGFKINYENVRMSGGSDHASFLNKKIPSLFFHSDTHADYHKVSDEVSLINSEKIARVAKLVYKTAWEIANNGEYFEVINN